MRDILREHDATGKYAENPRSRSLFNKLARLAYAGRMGLCFPSCASTGCNVLLRTRKRSFSVRRRCIRHTPIWRSALPVPVINPRPLTYNSSKPCCLFGITRSSGAYPRPRVSKPELRRAMFDRTTEFRPVEERVNIRAK